MYSERKHKKSVSILVTCCRVASRFESRRANASNRIRKEDGIYTDGWTDERTTVTTERIDTVSVNNILLT